MEHLLLKATVTTTDQGLFTAVISAASVDREKDIVRPEAMVAALKAWESTGKMIPLAWNHSSAPEDIIGHIDPSTAEKVGSEVVAAGFMDQTTAKGAEAWRLAKSGTLGFSFGYLITAGTNRKGGGRDIIGLDVFEITATPTPMNNDTRVLSTKAVEGEAPDFEALTQRLTSLEESVKALVEAQAEKSVTSEPETARDDLRKRSDMAVLEVQSDGASLRKPPQQVQETPPPEPASELELKRRSRNAMLELLTGDAA